MPTVEDLQIRLEALGFDHEAVDNQQDALARFASGEFCLVILDLQIKLTPESLKAHAEAGRELLRQMRAISPRYTADGRPSVPIVVVSGYAREADEAVEAMKDGANDVVQKPTTNARGLSDRLRRALEACGRSRHELCTGAARWILSVPAEQDKRRFSVQIRGVNAWLTTRSLELLLLLIIGKLKGVRLHKTDLGWDEDHGFRAMSRLREQLAQCGVAGEEIVVNRHHGQYELAEDLEIGACDPGRLRAIGGEVARLAEEISALRARAAAGP